MAEAAAYSVQDLGTSLRLVMPYRTQWVNVGLQVLTLLFLTAVLVLLAWSVSKLLVTRWFLLALSPFLALGLLLVLAPGAIWTLELLWQLAGKEVVEVDGDGIAIHHQVWGSRVSKRLPAEAIERVFVAARTDTGLAAHFSAGSSMFSPRLFRPTPRQRFDRGQVALALGADRFGDVVTVRFGSSLDEAQSRQVVATVHGKFPRYAPVP